MRCPARLGGAILPLVVFAAALAVADGPAAADPGAGSNDGQPELAGSEDGSGDERTDVAVPLTPEELAAQLATVPSRPVPHGPSAAGRIDDFRYDDTRNEGRAAEICHRRIRRGAMWTFLEITDRFGGWAGSMYSCRERWDVANDPDCNGTIVDPVAQPDFRSTCWSNHAQGRAIDVMVGTAGPGDYNSRRGRTIIRWLLASDGAGNQNARARRLGVQQILFDDRCWNSDGDRGIGRWAGMRECAIGHHDHIHIDFSYPGANGNVSWWGATAEVHPKINSLLSWNRDTGRWSIRTFTNLRSSVTHGSSWRTGWDEIVAGDWDEDGRIDDLIQWRRSTGRWMVRSFARSHSTIRSSGTWPVGYGGVVAGDFNGDRHVNELFLYDRASGRWQLKTFTDFAIRRRVSGTFGAGYDRLTTADLDGDGIVSELLLSDVASGQWMANHFFRLVPHHVSSGRWQRGWDRVRLGDFDADGELDETLLWRRSTGRWVIQNWVDNQPEPVRRGTFRRARDDIAIVDLDTDGRLDDAAVLDRQTGRVAFHRWHALDRRLLRITKWRPGLDRVVAGTWN